MEKQNKFSNTMPEAERLCRQTGSPSSSCRTEERIFKRCQKQRASPLPGKRAGSDAVSQHAIQSGSSVRKYNFIFIPCLCRKVCGPPDNTTICVFVCVGNEITKLTGSCLLHIYMNVKPVSQLLIQITDSLTNPTIKTTKYIIGPRLRDLGKEVFSLLKNSKPHQK